MERRGPGGRSRDFQLYTWADWSRLAPLEGEPFIQAVRFRLRVPEVIALSQYDRVPTSIVAFSRRNLFKRDHYTCQYCGTQPGSEDLTIDHVLPRSLGGLTNWENCVLACVDCNKRKANRSPQQAGMQAAQAAHPARVAAALRHGRRADRQLEPLHQRGLLERRAARVSVSSPLALSPCRAFRDPLLSYCDLLLHGVADLRSGVSAG